MDRTDVINRIMPIMADIFDADGLEYSDSLTAEDVEEWDSLSHIRFVVAVEKAFGVRFTTDEIEGFDTVGELVDMLAGKAGQAA